jgi:predicted enzyme involved in methoxymalonyl-ACP biosynthesis
LIVDQAQRLGARRIIGEYIPTKKNSMVKDHYERLGFKVFEHGPDGESRAAFELADFASRETFIHVEEGDR